MLRLQNIVKDYTMGDMTVHALKKINIEFRRSEFVSILGPSGCGKTTLLNIIGGLDQYTSGNLYINGRSTKKFKDRDWDHYRNHSIGFVFQNYNLIHHQNVLSNVELALTLSGISKSERRKRAIAVLEQVGLGDQLHKKPNQLSGGQMQRVAIARALINDPEILLADEPTGALDSETSVQIMEILKQISNDRLIIMVTHNPDLAERYSTRIVRLLDGNITGDSNPYYNHDFKLDRSKSKRKRLRGNSMSFMTALSLSLNNLLTKKGRTFMTAFAGSIGIIGIALILSLSHGVQNYINKVEEDTLSSYPITIEDQTIDVTNLMTTMMGMANAETVERDPDRIYSRNIVGDMLNTMFAQIETNNLEAFKKFIESDESGIAPYLNGIQYGYDIDLNIYKSDYADEIKRVNPNSFFEDIGMPGGMSGGSMMSSYSNQDVWVELIDNRELLHSQYDVLAGEWPDSYDEAVIIVDDSNELSDYTLYSLGLKDTDEIADAMEGAMKGESIEIDSSETSYSYDELLSLRFRLVLSSDYYEKNSKGVWIDKSDNSAFMKNLLDRSPEIKIVGIIRPNDETVTAALNGSVGYTSDLTKYVIDSVDDSEIVKAQRDDPDTDVFTGKPFADPDAETDESAAQLDMSALSLEEQQYIASLSQEELQSFMESYSAESDATYDENLAKLGVVDLDVPNTINMYATDFESKEAITDIIAQYNREKTDAGEEEYVISYTDIVGVMMKSVTSIVNIISYVLIAFVAISLIVSSIMIGIITYISVLERTKEIGILRSIGASKKDISRVFNAETVIVGFIAGAVGILITLVLLIPINLIIEGLSGIASIAALPWIGGIALIIISMALTVIAGLLPAGVAAKKDPVEALRTE